VELGQPGFHSGQRMRSCLPRLTASLTERGPVQSYSDVPIFQRNRRSHLK
jgi:hypothetical protein